MINDNRLITNDILEKAGFEFDPTNNSWTNQITIFEYHPVLGIMNETLSHDPNDGYFFSTSVENDDVKGSGYIIKTVERLKKLYEGITDQELIIKEPPKKYNHILDDLVKTYENVSSDDEIRYASRQLKSIINDLIYALEYSGMIDIQDRMYDILEIKERLKKEDD